MVEILSGSLLLLLATTALLLQRVYATIPIRELRRQARQRDALAHALYRVAAYGSSLRFVLWSFVVLTLPVGLLITLHQLPVGAALALLVVLTLIFFVWIPSLQLSLPTARFAAAAAPVLARVLLYVHAPLQKLIGLTRRFQRRGGHSGLYEKQDLIELLYRQQAQPDNRIAPQDLELAARALAFDNRTVADVLQPSAKLRMVNADDAVGPVLLDQMYAHDQKTCLVYKDRESNIIGSLHMSDAAKAKQGGRVFDLIRTDLVFIHEDFTLKQVLAAFQETGQHIAAVVNKFEEFLGVVTFDMLMKELIGELQTDTVGNYTDRQAVAAYEPAVGEQPENQEDEFPEQEENPSASLEVTEVIK